MRLLDVRNNGGLSSDAPDAFFSSGDCNLRDGAVIKCRARDKVRWVFSITGNPFLIMSEVDNRLDSLISRCAKCKNFDLLFFFNDRNLGTLRVFFKETIEGIYKSLGPFLNLPPCQQTHK